MDVRPQVSGAPARVPDPLRQFPGEPALVAPAEPPSCDAPMLQRSWRHRARDNLRGQRGDRSKDARGNRCPASTDHSGAELEQATVAAALRYTEWRAQARRFSRGKPALKPETYGTPPSPPPSGAGIAGLPRGFQDFAHAAGLAICPWDLLDDFSAARGSARMRRLSNMCLPMVAGAFGMAAASCLCSKKLNWCTELVLFERVFHYKFMLMCRRQHGRRAANEAQKASGPALLPGRRRCGRDRGVELPTRARVAAEVPPVKLVRVWAIDDIVFKIVFKNEDGQLSAFGRPGGLEGPPFEVPVHDRLRAVTCVTGGDQGLGLRGCRLETHGGNRSSWYGCRPGVTVADLDVRVLAARSRHHLTGLVMRGDVPVGAIDSYSKNAGSRPCRATGLGLAVPPTLHAKLNQLRTLSVGDQSSAVAAVTRPPRKAVVAVTLASRPWVQALQHLAVREGAGSKHVCLVNYIDSETSLDGGHKFRPWGGYREGGPDPAAELC
ncbi:unnamed protein product, partial [Prorocentrum cordatum]